jgi:hypothetical protein
MANSITATTIPARTYVTVSSRYVNSTVVTYGDTNVLTFETYVRQLKPPSDNDKYAVVPPGEEFRPDLTSYRAYGTVDFWWLILENNGIFDIFDYKAGTNIRIPSAFNLV